MPPPRQKRTPARAAPAKASRSATPGGRTPAPPAAVDEDDRVKQLSEPLAKVLRRLPEIERRVLRLRMGLEDGHPHDSADTARALGLSSSEVRDIERRAFERIREIVPLGQLHKLLHQE